jgi:protoheme IX farnesyltransferase
MPSVDGPTKYSAVQSVIYSLVLIPVGFLPYWVGMSGLMSLLFVLIANLGMIWFCVKLYKDMERSAARQVMFASYFYLPLVLFALLADKIW